MPKKVSTSPASSTSEKRKSASTSSGTKTGERRFRRISDEEQVAILQRMERLREELISGLEEANALVMSLGGEAHPNVKMGG